MAEWLDANRVLRVRIQELIDAQGAVDRLSTP
jgi:hypothetical protein